MTPTTRFRIALLAAFMTSAAASSWTLYRGLLREDCGLQAAQARAMVVEDLRRRGRPVRRLEETGADGACRHAFVHIDGPHRVEYAVSNDWVRGVRVVRRERVAMR